jgi:dihydrofolate synthase/folylpolyglutamate synthase
MRSNKPVVVMDDDCPTSVLEHAAALNSELRLVGRDFDYGHDQLTVNTRYYSVPQTQLPLPSAIGAVVGFLEAGFEVSQDELTRALEVASLPGRFQIIGNKPVTVMDVCHNPDAAEYLAKKLVQIPDVDEWHFVIGIYRDKDQGGIFHNLSPLKSTWYFCDLPGPRGANAIDLSRVLHETCGLSSQTYDKVSTALDAAIYTVKNAAKNDVELRQGIAILGSFSTVGAALQHLNLDVTEATH